MPSKVKRVMTSYPGVYYIMSKASDGRPERIYYIFYRKDGKQVEEKVGRQFKEKMTPARANQIRTRRIEGGPTNREQREAARQQQWTISNLWEDYAAHNALAKVLRPISADFENSLSRPWGTKSLRISPLDVDRLRIAMTKKYAPQTLKHVLSLLQRIVNHGARLGLCPGLKFKLPTIKVHNLKTEDLNPGQLAALMGAINEEYDSMAANFMRLPYAPA